MNTRLNKMIADGAIPLAGGVWIDCYNQQTNAECAGTIIAGINSKNHYFVTDICELRILDLSICYKWYDMIESGEKTEEYREIKKYWTDRLINKKAEPIQGKFFPYKEYDAVRFHRGQGGKQTMLFEYKGFTIGIGNPLWGAPEDKEVFIIRLGKRLDITKPQVLGWTRDEKGNVINRHPVEVANAVTAAKRDNTQNYVIENDLDINAMDGYWEREIHVYNIPSGVRIRKLTPRECFRLMGVRDEDIDKIQAAGISKSQQYKLAGNSIVVNTLAAIFRQLLIGNFNKNQQTEIF